MLPRSAVWCGVVQCVAACHTSSVGRLEGLETLSHMRVVAACCGVLQCVASCQGNEIRCPKGLEASRKSALWQYVVVCCSCCSVLQRVAVCCSVLEGCDVSRFDGLEGISQVRELVIYMYVYI